MKLIFAQAKAHFEVGWQSIAKAPVAMLGGIGFYAIILFVFTRIWEIVLAERVDAGISAEEAVWYLAATEWIILSVPRSHQDIPQDIWSGALTHDLLRPLSYLSAKFAQMLGALAANLVILGLAGMMIAFAFTGYLPSPARLFTLSVLGPIGAVLGLIIYTIVGVAGYWFGRGIGPYIVVQKFVFVLGGLLLPLFIYPAWLQDIALLSPFAAMLFRPASVLFETFGSGLAEIVLVELASAGFWIVLSGSTLIILYRRVVTRLIS